MGHEVFRWYNIEPALTARSEPRHLSTRRDWRRPINDVTGPGSTRHW